MMDKKKILVVEDENELLGLIVKKLGASGFETVSTQTVRGALEALDGDKFDAVWLDHYLSGGKNGFDLVVQIKANAEKYGKLPIFVVSNTAGPDEVQSYINFGVDKYYVKTNATLNKIVEDIGVFLNA